ncbi:hypothetical protein [Candidatus Cyrtobacter comes]|uniref:hypothetical protein n=1 Tax=Candidatus Cyrtobacter comes TaxID=675776 RepID=UPI002ACD28B0|nr:hypothetical protein [Candidatus Cyrtobacter comes]
MATNTASDFGLSGQCAENFSMCFEKILKEELLNIYDGLKSHNFDSLRIFQSIGINEEVKNKYELRRNSLEVF